MQTEKEYLFEVWQALDAINKSTDEGRKQEMKNHLHKKVYPKKHRYGFTSIEDVRKSVECLKAGKPDLTEKQRYEKLKQTIEVLKEALSNYENTRDGKAINGKEVRLSLSYNRLKEQEREPGIDLTRD